MFHPHAFCIITHRSTGHQDSSIKNKIGKNEQRSATRDASPPRKRGSGTERGRWTWTGPNRRRLPPRLAVCCLPFWRASSVAGGPVPAGGTIIQQFDPATGRLRPRRQAPPHDTGAGARRPVVHWCWGAAAIRLSGDRKGTLATAAPDGAVRALPSPSAATARPTNRVGRTDGPT